MFRFPNPVDERAARTVALGVVVLTVTTLVTQQHWLLVPIVYGFAARVASGPRFSPLGLLATRVVVPRLAGPPRLTAGPPKRFAQFIGLVATTTALVLALPLGMERAADILLVAVVGAAGLEAFLGVCMGCLMFALGMRAGIVPEPVCAACATISLRRGEASI